VVEVVENQDKGPSGESWIWWLVSVQDVEVVFEKR
jgi:hypothetical protein